MLLLLPSPVLAVDEATAQAIDSKSSSANVKADVNICRVQASGRSVLNGLVLY